MQLRARVPTSRTPPTIETGPYEVTTPSGIVPTGGASEATITTTPNPVQPPVSVALVQGDELLEPHTVLAHRDAEPAGAASPGETPEPDGPEPDGPEPPKAIGEPPELRRPHSSPTPPED
jgi:hypothetical protein